MMGNYSLTIMPGMSYNSQLLTHLFLCFPSDSAMEERNESGHWNPSEHPHPALSEEKTVGAPNTLRTIFTRSGGLWRTLAITSICVLDEEFVMRALDGKSAIGRAVRDMRLEVVSLAQSPLWKFK
jgi:hypothetical protein